MPTIEFSDVEVRYENRVVLRPLSCTLTENRIGIVGANGSGKSTFLRLINGLGSPTSGVVSVDGLPVADNGKQVRKKVGFMFSDAENQIIMPTVKEDIGFSLKRFKLPAKQREQRALAMLERYGLATHADDSPYTLSGGQKQLLALASILIMEPSVILLDEPTTLLDLRNRVRIKKELSRLDQQIIVATHDLALLEGFDRVIYIADGTIRADGTPDNVLPTYVSEMTDDH
ncbi:energy-coupling factor ABC transporter ATP-binding protein [Corynebacterium glucuronolyticum]